MGPISRLFLRFPAIFDNIDRHLRMLAVSMRSPGVINHRWARQL